MDPYFLSILSVQSILDVNMPVSFVCGRITPELIRIISLIWIVEWFISKQTDFIIWKAYAHKVHRSAEMIQRYLIRINV